MTQDTIQEKIDSLNEQEEQLKVMFQKIQGAKEALIALKQELAAETNGTTDTTETKKAAKTKK